MFRTALIALAACSLAACATAADRRDDRQVSGFNALALGANVKLEVVQDGSESLDLQGDAETLDRIETYVKDGTLHINYRRGTHVLSDRGVTGVLHARTLDRVALSGTGQIHSRALKGESLAVAVSGTGDIDIGDVQARSAKVSVSGTGTVSVAGRTEELQARISGTGDVKAAKLETQRAEVSIAGTGDATVWAREKLAAAVSGMGSVRYYGDPGVTQRVAGLGSVKRIAATP
ncbi:MAG TPA: head GIN domain-containing protein [Usitatibacter sp.]|nr:head GIN domain-containing protein [Usitatibacter sp.]